MHVTHILGTLARCVILRPPPALQGRSEGVRFLGQTSSPRVTWLDGFRHQLGLGAIQRLMLRVPALFFLRSSQIRHASMKLTRSTSGWIALTSLVATPSTERDGRGCRPGEPRISMCRPEHPGGRRPDVAQVWPEALQASRGSCVSHTWHNGVRSDLGAIGETAQ